MYSKSSINVRFKDFWYTKINLSQKYIFIYKLFISIQIAKKNSHYSDFSKKKLFFPSHFSFWDTLYSYEKLGYTNKNVYIINYANIKSYEDDSFRAIKLHKLIMIIFFLMEFFHIFPLGRIYNKGAENILYLKKGLMLLFAP